MMSTADRKVKSDIMTVQRGRTRAEHWKICVVQMRIADRVRALGMKILSRRARWRNDGMIFVVFVVKKEIPA